MRTLCLFLMIVCTSVANSQVKLVSNTELYGAVIGNNRTFMTDSVGNLWTTDGTPAGTKIFTTKVRLSEGGNGVIASDKIYFSGYSAAYGDELWCTDGTDAGTYLVKNITAGNGSTPFGAFYVFNDKVCFFADDNVHGLELWITDGTESGTKLLKDIRAGAQGSHSENDWPSHIVANNFLFFEANDGQHGYEIWRTNGTTQGTVLVKDIVPNTPGEDAPLDWEPVNVGNIVFFAINDDVHGQELWRSDGMTAGTYMVKDIWPGQFDGMKGDLHVFKNQVYFQGYSPNVDDAELWTSNGTAAGTVRIATLPAATNEYVSIDFENMVNFTDKFLFSFHSNDAELWTSDGTAPGTKKLTAVGEAGYIWIYLGRTYDYEEINTPPLNGKVFLQTFHPGEGAKLWLTDGTNSGTVLVMSLTETNSYLYGANHFYFFGSHQTAADSIALYRSDGTSSGTIMLHALSKPPQQYYYDVFPNLQFEYNGSVYYSADDRLDNQNKLDFFRSGPVPQAGTVYTFIGNGNWSNPANWQNGLVPPANMTNGEIVINPAPGGECILTGTQVIPAGGKLIVLGNKTLRIVN